MDFNVLKVGKPFTPFLGAGEGVRFDIDATGATLFYCFDRPTSDEVDAMRSEEPFEIRFVSLGGIVWILTKCGGLEWTDAPYDPRLSTGIPGANEMVDGGGLGLMLAMLDSRDAVVKSLRLVGLGHGFSRRLLDEVHRVKQQPLTRMQAMASISKTMAAYKTKQLVAMAPQWARFKL